MAFVERSKHSGKIYYQVTSTHRLPGGGWKKLRKYYGQNPPTLAEVSKAETELAVKAKKIGLVTGEKTWTVVEELPLGPPGRGRPLTILGGIILRFSHKHFQGVISFGKCLLDSVDGQVKWIIPAESVTETANITFKKIIGDPGWAEKINENVENTARGAFAYFRSFPKDFSSFTDEELSELFEEAISIIGDCQEVGQAWLALDFPHTPPFVEYLTNYLQKQSKTNAGALFSLLTTSNKASNAQKEEIALGSLATIIQEEEELFQLFISNKIFNDAFFSSFQKINPRVARLFQKHVEEFQWLPFMYEGPVWDRTHFAGAISNLLRSRPRVDALQKESSEKAMALSTKQESLVRSLKIDDEHSRLIEIARETVWGRGYRKDAIYFGFSKLLPLYKEMAKRLNLPLSTFYYLFWWEIPEVFLGKKTVSAAELGLRNKHWTLLAIDGVPGEILAGKNADNFMKTMRLDVVATSKNIQQLTGTCASPGQGRGVVCIINSSADLFKMKEGSVLVSHATDPSLVMAMKKASAIVTDMGGLASHAAIVSRELGVPCLIGTRTATRVLTDGELVHVDATHGIVRKLQKM